LQHMTRRCQGCKRMSDAPPHECTAQCCKPHCTPTTQRAYDQTLLKPKSKKMPVKRPHAPPHECTAQCSQPHRTQHQLGVAAQRRHSTLQLLPHALSRRRQRIGNIRVRCCCDASCEDSRHHANASRHLQRSVPVTEQDRQHHV
jgi:hypothetical protein